MNQTAKELARLAKKSGICEEWYRELQRLDTPEQMVAMYIRGIDFCLSNDFPTNDYIRTHFKGRMESQGVFLDDSITLKNPRYCVALGDTQGSIHITDYAVSEVFAKHQARLSIIAEGNAFVEVDLFDDAELTITARGNAKVHVNRYKGLLHTQREGAGSIKVVEKGRTSY